MKIANAPLRLLPYAVYGILAVAAAATIRPAFAADAAAPLAPPVAAAASLPAPSPVDAATAMPGRAGSKNLSPLEDKVTDSVRNVVKQFGALDSVNLDDLNTAHQAIAKLDVLIEIEKKMAELKKIKNEDSGMGGGSNAFAGAIPASALAAPPAATHNDRFLEKAGADGMGMPHFGVSSHESLTRIEGANGNFAAVIDGKTYYVGDKLPNGSAVVSISAQEVETRAKDGEIHHLKVKGVQQVYGHNL